MWFTPPSTARRLSLVALGRSSRGSCMAPRPTLATGCDPSKAVLAAAAGLVTSLNEMPPL